MQNVRYRAIDKSSGKTNEYIWGLDIVPNPKNRHTLTLSQSTYDKLVALKGRDLSFEDVVRKLVDMDLKYNSTSETIEYEFLTETNAKVFKVTFEGNNRIVEYWGRNKFSNKITAWDNYPPISDEDKDLFIKFITQEKSFRLLKDMDQAIEFKEFLVRKIG